MNEYTYDQIKIGTKESFQVSIEKEMVDIFCCLTKDVNPLHTDSGYAYSVGYKDKVVYGLLTASFLSTLAGVYLPGKRSLIMETNIKYVKPVYCNDNIKVSGVVVDKNDLFKFIVLRVDMEKLNGEKVLKLK